MRGCATGGKVRYIDYRGNVMPCPFITYSPFNVSEILDCKREDLSDAFFDELRQLVNQNNHECLVRNHPELVLQTFKNHQKTLTKTANRSDVILRGDKQ